MFFTITLGPASPPHQEEEDGGEDGTNKAGFSGIYSRETGLLLLVLE